MLNICNSIKLHIFIQADEPLNAAPAASPKRYKPFFMRQFLLFIVLFVVTFATGQTKSLFIGEWQFFDKDSSYCEWTVTPKYLFQYCDSAQPTKQKISLTNKTLTVSPNLKWTIKEYNKDYLLVDINHHLLRFFPKQSRADTVKSLYDFLHDEHNGRAATVFIRDANERKQELIVRTKNGL